MTLHEKKGTCYEGEPVYACCFTFAVECYLLSLIVSAVRVSHPNSPDAPAGHLPLHRTMKLKEISSVRVEEEEEDLYQIRMHRHSKAVSDT